MFIFFLRIDSETLKPVVSVFLPPQANNAKESHRGSITNPADVLLTPRLCHFHHVWKLLDESWTIFAADTESGSGQKTKCSEVRNHWPVKVTESAEVGWSSFPSARFSDGADGASGHCAFRRELARRSLTVGIPALREDHTRLMQPKCGCVGNSIQLYLNCLILNPNYMFLTLYLLLLQLCSVWLAK